MNCTEAKKIVEDFVVAGGASPPTELMQHLRTCPACAARFLPLINLASELQRMPEKALPEGFDLRFRQKMAARLRTGAKNDRVSAVMGLLAMDAIRWGLVLLLSFSLGPIAGMLSGSLEAPTRVLTFPAPHFLVLIACLLLASAISYAMFSSDILTNIFKRRTR